METAVYQLLNSKRQQIVTRWQSAALNSSTNHDTLEVRKKGERFADPMGFLIEKNIELMVDWLLGPDNKVNLSLPVGEICRFKAIQQAKPAEALGFIFSLKQIIRDVIKDENGSIDRANELWIIDNRIDEIGLLAFNAYSDCRAEIYELRIKEIKRMLGREVG